jgi:hypothetical protein
MCHMITSTNSGTSVPDEVTLSKDITFATCECVLGQVLVARSAVGVCAILIGSDPENLEGDLAARFPGSTLIANEPRLRDDLSKVARFLETPSEGIDLYQLPVKATHVGDSQSEADVIHRGKRVGVCHGCGDWGSRG